MQRKIDSATLEMALVGYTAELRKIEEKVTAIRKHLRGGAKIPVVAPAVSDGSGPKRRLSWAARKRIAAAQKKRWREFHAKQKAATGAAR
jgi:hypothetical protein